MIPTSSRLTKIVLLLAISVSFSDCSKKKNDEHATQNDSIQNLNNTNSSSNANQNTNTDKINIEVDGDMLKNVRIPKTLEDTLVEGVDEANLGISELITQLKQKKPISFSKITDHFITKHLRMYEKIRESLKITDPTPTFGDFKKTISNLESKVIEKSDLHELKIQMENAIGDLTSYNRDFSTVPNVILQKKLQCYSGTSTFEIFARDVLNAKAFIDKHMVILMTKGHILSGYMEKDKDGDWVLVGIESTAPQKAKVSFGKIKNLHNVAAMRIYDANLWMILEILLSYEKDSPLVKGKIDESKIAAEARAITDEMYDGQIPVDELEKVIDELLKNEKPKDGDAEGTNADVGEESGFGGFGASDVPPGDIPRVGADEIDPKVYNHMDGGYSRVTAKSTARSSSGSVAEPDTNHVKTASGPVDKSVRKSKFTCPNDTKIDEYEKYLKVDIGINYYQRMSSCSDIFDLLNDQTYYVGYIGKRHEEIASMAKTSGLSEEVLKQINDQEKDNDLIVDPSRLISSNDGDYSYVKFEKIAGDEMTPGSDKRAGKFYIYTTINDGCVLKYSRSTTEDEKFNGVLNNFTILINTRTPEGTAIQKSTPNIFGCFYGKTDSGEISSGYFLLGNRNPYSFQ